jgi:HD-GYP domain-containing protein (c-di-GMP phosphodiesterase class II)
VRRRLISGYIEGFLQREHTGPEHLEELISTLKKMVGEGDRNATVLREAIETLTGAAESRELNSSGHGEMVARYSEIIARSLGLPQKKWPICRSPPGCTTLARFLFPSES